MTVLGWTVIVVCLVVYVADSARRHVTASGGVRRRLADLLGLEAAGEWPQPSVVGPGDAARHDEAEVLTGVTSTGRRLWLDLDSPYYRPTGFAFVAASVEVGDLVDDLRIAPGGAWTKVHPHDDSFRRRFNVSGVTTLDPTLRDVVAATSPSAIEIEHGRLTVVTTRGDQPRLADASRALGVLAALVDALDESYHGLATGVGELGIDVLAAADDETGPEPSDRLFALLLAATVVGAALVLAG